MKNFVSALIAGLIIALVAWLASSFHGDGRRGPLPEPPWPHSGGVAPQSAPADGSRVVNNQSHQTGVSREAVLPTTVPTPCIEFQITGVRASECVGQLTQYWKTGEVSTKKIDGPAVSVDLKEGMRKIEFVVDSHSIAEFRGPFEESDEPIEVPLRKAGMVLVDVADTTGRVLDSRLVYCHQVNSTSVQGKIVYRTTQWAYTDQYGRASIQNVIPGEYNVTTGGVAEWGEAMATGVRVQESCLAHCKLSPRVMEPDSFGGFTMDWEAASFLEITASGVVKKYQFWTDEGRQYKMFKIGEALRCAVPGKVGEVVRGRIQWRSGGGAEEQSKESGDIVLTIGAVQKVELGWRPAK